MYAIRSYYGMFSSVHSIAVDEVIGTKDALSSRDLSSAYMSYVNKLEAAGATPEELKRLGVVEGKYAGSISNTEVINTLKLAVEKEGSLTKAVGEEYASGALFRHMASGDYHLSQMGLRR